jgi:hypothetical protein
VGTRQEGMTHEVLVVKNFEELRQKQALVSESTLQEFCEGIKIKDMSRLLPR